MLQKCMYMWKNDGTKIPPYVIKKFLFLKQIEETNLFNQGSGNYIGCNNWQKHER
jgi:hypothetical protein